LHTQFIVLSSYFWTMWKHMLFISNINVLPFVDLHWAGCLDTRKHVTIFHKSLLSDCRCASQYLSRRRVVSTTTILFPPTQDEKGGRWCYLGPGGLPMRVSVFASFHLWAPENGLFHIYCAQVSFC
jgi:hypothetical protein